MAEAFNNRLTFPFRAELTVVLLFVSLPLVSANDGPLPPVEFARDVYPLLQKHCLRCHAGRDAESGFRLDVRREILGETNGEPLAVVGKSGESRIVQRVRATDARLRMPPEGEGERLAATEIATLARWIDQGLAWDDQVAPPPSEPVDHWAFRPIARPTIPALTSHRTWARTPIDAFIGARLEHAMLEPNSEVDRARWLRRVTLDLTGLPPTWEEAEEFIEDDSPDAVVRQVDRLLASPRYGERWGRHWLDVARWAESEGFESNHMRPYAWRYRDYVVRRMNQDESFATFLREQLAGDELQPLTDERLIATGFLAGARLSSNEEDKALQRNDVLVDIVNLVGEGVLGLTMGCAQCHNHKFDPITQRDYYRLQALFVRGQPANLALRDPHLVAVYEQAKPTEYEPATTLLKAIYERVRLKLLNDRREKLSADQRLALDTPIHQRTPAQQELARQSDLELQLLTGQVEREIVGDDKMLYESLKKKIASIEKSLPDRPQAWGFYSPATASERVDVLPMKGFYPLVYDEEMLKNASAYLLVRGDVHRLGPKLDSGGPAVLEAIVSNSSSAPISTRSQLVDWLVDRRHPLTARVWANRVWHYHFGRGIVETPGDFGLKGAEPSHPELLDFLACECLDHDWSTKRLHRMLVTSSVYGLSAQPHPRGMEVDPENRMWWRFEPRRLEAEAVRDSLLVVADQLALDMGGASDDEKKSRRRTIYVTQKRDQMPEVQRLFDGATANETCGRRLVSTVSLQPLFLMNSPFAAELSAKFADRVRALEPASAARQIELAFQFALARKPAADELAAGIEFIRQADAANESITSTAGRDEQPTAANSTTAVKSAPETTRNDWSGLRQFCQLLVNLNEFLYLE
ncbi:MAG: PSD1 and planctomycete cytochrome C domain-containing protein [Pirellulales bacterium]